jgi:DNA polymerase-3 subunit gamma/tau
MLSLVDELERNGGSTQHFSRELARYIRNLLVTKISKGDSRLIAASPSERAEMGRIAAQFSEEDLTRYLQLSLDLFKDLQESLQPRFHLEIGLLKMVQASRLTGIEEAIANVGQTLPPAAAPKAPAPMQAKAPLPQTAPQAAPQPVAPQPIDDWRARLQEAMTKAGLTFSADAIAQSDVQVNNNELLITASKEYQLDLGREEIATALKQLGYPSMRFKVVFGTPQAAPDTPAPVKPAVKEDEVTVRALADPEVQRFREIFGGEVRAVRDLKEPWKE